jgi:hypothetical protein
MAEGVGFEPTVHQRRTTVFETVPINHSGTPPGRNFSLAARTGVRKRSDMRMIWRRPAG